MPVFTAGQALEMALEIEQNGEAYYNAVIDKMSDPEIKVLFKDLAAQERIHYQVFQRMLGNVKPAPELPAEEYDQYDAYLHAALGNALFAGPDKALLLAERGQRYGDSHPGALGFEKDTLLFFYDLREMVSEKDRDAITRVIARRRRTYDPAGSHAIGDPDAPHRDHAQMSTGSASTTARPISSRVSGRSAQEGVTYNAYLIR